jgi:hypothetical protein
MDPDWVENVIEVRHASKPAIHWLEGILLKATNGIFASICPVGNEDDDEWFDRCCQTWRTPMDIFPRGDRHSPISSLKISEEPHGGTIYFECVTTLYPPRGVLETLRERGFDVTCRHLTNDESLGYWINGEDIQVISGRRGENGGDVGFNANHDLVEVLRSRERCNRELNYSSHMVVRNRTAILHQHESCIQRLADGSTFGAGTSEIAYLKGLIAALAWVQGSEWEDRER